MNGCTRRPARNLALLAAGLAAAAVAGCSDGGLPRISDLNPFAEKQAPLPGKREPVILPEKASAELASAERPIVLPPARQVDHWTQPGGDARNALVHVNLGTTLRQVWSADAGTGSSSSGRLTASPVVFDGRVYTLDAAGRVTAFSVAGGGVAWRTPLAPGNEKDYEGYGGGLAIDEGRIYAATGYGVVFALDAKTGKKLWEKPVGAPVRTSPTASAGKVVVAGSDGVVHCLAGGDGQELWQFRGLTERASILSNASPAIEGDFAVVPFPSGDIVALRMATGQTAWSETVARKGVGFSLGTLSDASRPSIDGGVVYAVGHAGRMIAASLKSGERIWQINVPGVQMPWAAGDVVFVVDLNAQLLAVDRKDGKLLWTAKLPAHRTWNGPVLAGSRLWLVSSEGKLVGVDAATGKVAQQQDLGTPVFIAPIVAGGRLYILTDKARLLVFG